MKKKQEMEKSVGQQITADFCEILKGVHGNEARDYDTLIQLRESILGLRASVLTISTEKDAYACLEQCEAALSRFERSKKGKTVNLSSATDKFLDGLRAMVVALERKEGEEVT